MKIHSRGRERGPNTKRIQGQTCGEEAQIENKPNQLCGYMSWAKSGRIEENATRDWTQGGPPMARACPWSPPSSLTFSKWPVPTTASRFTSALNMDAGLKSV
jgi:hypothetical protein